MHVSAVEMHDSISSNQSRLRELIKMIRVHKHCYRPTVQKIEKKYINTVVASDGLYIAQRADLHFNKFGLH